MITRFDSIKAVAARHYPALLVKWLLRHPFPSAEMAPQARVPALFLIAENDEVIAPAHALALARAWGGPKQVRAFANVGHNDIDQHPGYYGAINSFLESLARTAQPETRYAALQLNAARTRSHTTAVRHSPKRRISD